MHPVERYQSEMWRNFDAPPKRKKKKKKNAKTILHGFRNVKNMKRGINSISKEIYYG